MKRKIGIILMLFLCNISNCYAANLKQYQYTFPKTLYNSSKQVNIGYNTETTYHNYDFFDEEGYFNSVCVGQKETTLYWTKFDKNLHPIKTLSWPLYYTSEGLSDSLVDYFKPFGGAIYYDKHLYVLYSKPAEGDTYAEQYEKNIFALGKYDKNGNRVALKEYKGINFNADTLSGQFYKREGTWIPFYGSSSISMAINDGVLAMFFGRNMFNSHQSSQLAFFDTNDLTHLSHPCNGTEPADIPESICSKYRVVTNHSISHSLGQRIIRTSDGGYLIAEAGDAGTIKQNIGIADDKLLETRGMIVSKIQDRTLASGTVLLDRKAKRMFHYSEAGQGSTGNNLLNSSIGNIIELEDGYMYIGAMEKELNGVFANRLNAPHQLVVQKFKKNFYTMDDPKDMMLLDTEVRTVTGEKATSSSISGTRIFLDGTEKDYGLKFLTDIKDYSVIMERAVKLENDNVAIIWEQDKVQDDGLFKSLELDTYETYYMVIDKDANIIVPATKLENVTMSGEEQYAYKDGIIYWTTTKNTSENNLIVNKLNPFKSIESISFTELEVSLEYGSSKKLNVTIDPIDTTDDKTITYKSNNPNIVRVDSNGNIKALYPGKAIITATSSNGKTATITVQVTGEAPYIQGDFNHDGVVKMNDVIKALRLSLRLEIATNQDLLIGDVDGDKQIKINDVIYILRKSLGL